MMNLHRMSPLALHLTLAVTLAGCASQTATESKTVNITSGTQFAVTGNADGLYFDMQGLLWSLPRGGGKATALTGPDDDLRLPQLSPDGNWLAAQSFAAGNWDIVLINLTDPLNPQKRVLTNHPADDLEPTWSRDGKRVLFTSDRAGNDDIWSVDVLNGAVTQLTRNPANEYAAAATDDEFMYVADIDRKTTLFLRRTGGLESLGDAPAGRLYAPRVSPNGAHIAWIQAAERNAFPGVAVNELVTLELESGRLRILSPEASDVFGMPPVWLDDNTLAYTADGEIKTVDLKFAEVNTVSFTANLPLAGTQLTPATPLAFSAEQQPVLGVVDPAVLPSGAIVFTALGDLWRLSIDNELTRITDDAFVERDVTVAPDGETLAYISDREGSMQIYVHNLITKGVERVTDNANGPRYPTFSPEGARLAYQDVGPIGTQDFVVRVLNFSTRKADKLRSAPKIWPGPMAWSTDGKHLTVAELHKTGRATDGRNRLMRINVQKDTAEVLKLPDGMTPDTGPTASMDGTQLALVIDGALYRAPVAADGRLSGKPELLYDALVESPAWAYDGSHVLVLGPDGLTRVAVATGKRTTAELEASWQPAAGPAQQIVHAGRVWDGRSDSYATDVDIVIENGRIVDIRRHSNAPEGVTVIDASEQTVIPGLIDHHVHFQPHQGEWVGRALLAFGVTTVVEPGGLPYESREHFESWQSGRRSGPRLVYTGPQLDGDRRTFHFASHIQSEQRLQRELERADQLGYGAIKTYRRLPPGLQTAAIRGAHKQGLPVTAHAALRNIGIGGDRTEHLRGSGRTGGSPKQSDLLNSYADIQAIYATPRASVVPTLVNQGGWFDIALAERFGPLDEIEQYATLYSPRYRGNLAGFGNMVRRNIKLVRAGLMNAGASLSEMQANGVNIVAGTDAPIFPYGLSLVVELQNYVDAGLSPQQALQTATVNAATAMGGAAEVGTLEAGKLADLVIVDGDPLMQVEDLLKVKGVMVNGRYQTLEALLATP